MADILVFSAHPDDAEFGMGASLVKFRKQGLSIALVVLTRGDAGTYGTPEERESELRESASKLGAELDILGLKDCQVYDNYENRLLLAGSIRRFRPRVIFAPYHTNKGYHRNAMAHPDHTALGTLARHAARLAKFRGLKDLGGEPWDAEHMIYYMLPGNRRPELINDVTCCMEEWEDIIKSFKSQLKTREGGTLEMLKRYREHAGRWEGVKYAEPFIIEEPILLDCLMASRPTRD